MKRITMIILLLITFQAFSQTTSYGLVLGINSTDTESSYNRIIYANDGPGLDGFNFGIYFDYPLNNKFGIKSYLTYNNEDESYSSFKESHFDIKVSSIQLSSTLKYHFKNEYNEGFYILSGPRITSILNTKNESLEELNNIHEKFNFGFQLGFGFTLFDSINTEFIGDYGFSNIIDIEDHKINTYNIKINLNFDIENLVK